MDFGQISEFTEPPSKNYKNLYAPSHVHKVRTRLRVDKIRGRVNSICRHGVIVGVDVGQVWSVPEGANIKYVKWGQFRAGEKWRIWEMLTSGKIGDELVVVYEGNGSILAKSGISRSVSEYCQKMGFNLRIVYSSRHLVRVRFEGLV